MLFRSDGRIYSAGDLKDMGVIDEICAKGHGGATVDKFVAAHARHRPARLALQRARKRMAPLDYKELCTVVDDWLAAAMVLPADELRVMEMLVQMQNAATG